MLLEGSCHCKSVTFSVSSPHPYPFNLCYCEICRKTAGGGGFAINLGAENETLKVEGQEQLKCYQAVIKNEDSGEAEESPAQRFFCSDCGSALWVWDPRWPELLHPFASAIDTALPEAPEQTHLMLDFKAAWVKPDIGDKDKQFARYPDESIEQWHSRLGLKK